LQVGHNKKKIFKDRDVLKNNSEARLQFVINKMKNKNKNKKDFQKSKKLNKSIFNKAIVMFLGLPVNRINRFRK
jgi:hypothetical protein